MLEGGKGHRGSGLGICKGRALGLVCKKVKTLPEHGFFAFPAASVIKMTQALKHGHVFNGLSSGRPYGVRLGLDKAYTSDWLCGPHRLCMKIAGG